MAIGFGIREALSALLRATSVGCGSVSRLQEQRSEQRIGEEITFYEVAFDFSISFSEEQERCREVFVEGHSMDGGDFKVEGGIGMLIGCV